MWINLLLVWSTRSPPFKRSLITPIVLLPVWAVRGTLPISRRSLSKPIVLVPVRAVRIMIKTIILILLLATPILLRRSLLTKIILLLVWSRGIFPQFWKRQIALSINLQV